MNINREWHLAHKMPKDATAKQRLTWHLDHTKHCKCRVPTAKFLEDLRKKAGK